MGAAPRGREAGKSRPPRPALPGTGLQGDGARHAAGTAMAARPLHLQGHAKGGIKATPAPALPGPERAPERGRGGMRRRGLRWRRPAQEEAPRIMPLDPAQLDAPASRPPLVLAEVRGRRRDPCRVRGRLAGREPCPRREYCGGGTARRRQARQERREPGARQAPGREAPHEMQGRNEERCRRAYRWRERLQVLAPPPSAPVRAAPQGAAGSRQGRSRGGARGACAQGPARPAQGRDAARREAACRRARQARRRAPGARDRAPVRPLRRARGPARSVHDGARGRRRGGGGGRRSPWWPSSGEWELQAVGILPAGIAQCAPGPRPVLGDRDPCGARAVGEVEAVGGKFRGAAAGQGDGQGDRGA